MRKHMFFLSLPVLFLTLAVLVLWRAPHARAQETDPKYLAEMDAYYQECSANGVTSTFYDCRCRAIKYLELREKFGDIPTPFEIRQQIESTCVNQDAIAGSHYEFCMQNYRRDFVTDIEKYCSCYANGVAAAFARTPVVFSSDLIQLRSIVQSICYKQYSAPIK